MAALLVALAVMSVMAAVALPVWNQAAQREKEAELIFRGEQYARAIGLFQRKTGPGALPPNIDLLVDQRFLRKKYKDPITAQDFQVLLSGQPGGAAPGSAGAGAGTPGRGGAAPGGLQPGVASGAQQPQGRGGVQGTQPGVAAAGIMGVVSKSTAASIRQYQSRSHYNEWTFVNVAATQQPGAPGGGAPGLGGVPGGRGNPDPAGRGRGGIGQQPGTNPGANPFGPAGMSPFGPGGSNPFGPGGQQPQPPPARPRL